MAITLVLIRPFFSPGHTPGHMAYLHVRDGSLIAGDAFTTQMGVIAAGVFKFYFPFPALFSWTREYAAESAKKLRNLKPVRLAVGHGKTIESPLAAMDQAAELAFGAMRENAKLSWLSNGDGVRHDRPGYVHRG